MRKLWKVLKKICRLLIRQTKVTVCVCGCSDVAIIERKTVPRIVLAKPIKPGFKRKLSIKSDEPLDADQNNQFLEVKRISGEASAPKIVGESTPTQTTVYLYGDGGIGTNVFLFEADGHVGEGAVVISLEVEYAVSHPDATVLEVAEEATEDEAI
jgi:hypothetical protein